MSFRRWRYVRSLTLLFITSLFFLALHVIDDALATGEPAEYGISAPEFFLYTALLYLVIPPLGLLLARRGQMLGLLIVLLYALQAFYGAGVNHIRHMFGDFGGSKLLPTLLGLFGVRLSEPQGYGMLSVLLGMAGIGQTPPHAHSLFSTIVVLVDTALNLALMAVAVAALYDAWRIRSTRTASTEAVLTTNPLKEGN